jgi:cellulose synthase/poly-beta-1,6-N-acetylglucosamine synthase-like glycosyltransferase/peptidoglycan/xylan/chitin deacetylase (PgdA/CDA1 family)
VTLPPGSGPPSPPSAIEPERATRARWRRLVPTPSLALIVVTVLMLACVLGINGITNAPGGNDHLAAPPAITDVVPPEILNGGPVIETTPDVTRSFAMPPRTIALTFDDGPDPRWTPEILEVLRRHDVPATFFVVGAVAAQHPEILRQIRAQGSALGVHTFTHPDLTTISAAHADAELSMTEMVINGSTGESSVLLRPPYSSSTHAIDDPHYASIVETGRQGYTTVLTDVDSKDFEHPGVDAVVANSTPRDGAGAVVLMHDAGGDRSETVAALDRLLPRLKAQGYRFTTPTEAVGLPAPAHPASTEHRILGTSLLVVVAFSTIVVDILTWALLVVGALVLVRLLIMLVAAGVHRRRRRAPGFRWGPPVTEPVSVIVPAYNEKANIAATVRSLAASRHPVEIIVVDDGSDDGTADIAASLRLPNVRVLRQPNGGKPAALNNGIANARHDLVVMIDGDTVFEPDTIPRLVQPFGDPQVGAVSGNAKVAANGPNGRRRLIAAWQHIEYVIGFNIDRRVYDVFRCMPTIPGAIGAFRRKVLLEVGGVSDETLAEDTDLTMAIGRAGWWVVYEETALAWTEAPATLQQLWRQRYRWSYGTMQSMWKHRHSVVERGPSGRFGRRGLAHLTVFQLALPLLAPLVDIFLIYGLIFLNPLATVGAWGAMLAMQLIGAVYAFRLEREKLGVLWLLPLQQLVYRQLMYAVLLRSTVTALSGIRLKWQRMRRVGGLDALVGPSSGVGGPIPLSGASLPPHGPHTGGYPAPPMPPPRRAPAGRPGPGSGPVRPPAPTPPRRATAGPPRGAGPFPPPGRPR